jgi:hypothetical protein
VLIRCPECGKRISDRVEVCPYCGIPQPASLRISALKQRRVAQHKVIRILATIVIVAIVATATTFSLVYRWPISYEVGAVTGTDTVSREDLEKIVDEAATTWNSAAGRTVAWRVPLGRKVEFDLQVNASLQEYLTTLAGLEYEEAGLLAGKNSAEEDLANVRTAYDWSINNPTFDWSRVTKLTIPSVSAPATQQHGIIDFSKIKILPMEVFSWIQTEGRRPTLQDVKTYVQMASVAAGTWKKANDRLQAFKKGGAYTDDPSSIDAGVRLTEGSPNRVTIAYFANTYTLTDVVVHQFGHLLLGTWDPHDSPSSQTAASLRSPWKVKLSGTGNR